MEPSYAYELVCDPREHFDRLVISYPDLTELFATNLNDTVASAAKTLKNILNTKLPLRKYADHPFEIYLAKSSANIKLLRRWGCELNEPTSKYPDKLSISKLYQLTIPITCNETRIQDVLRECADNVSTVIVVSRLQDKLKLMSHLCAGYYSVPIIIGSGSKRARDVVSKHLSNPEKSPGLAYRFSNPSSHPNGSDKLHTHLIETYSQKHFADCVSSLARNWEVAILTDENIAKSQRVIYELMQRISHRICLLTAAEYERFDQAEIRWLRLAFGSTINLSKAPEQAKHIVHLTMPKQTAKREPANNIKSENFCVGWRANRLCHLTRQASPGRKPQKVERACSGFHILGPRSSCRPIHGNNSSGSSTG